MNRYNFDQMIDRRNTDCVKYDGLQDVFGCADLLPMWVADMDFGFPRRCRRQHVNVVNRGFSVIRSVRMMVRMLFVIG